MKRRATEPVGGRLSRAMRSRLAICDACLDLVQEGLLQPSADQIADRAGLSRRSIFYHFNDLGALYDAVVEAGMRRYAPLAEEIPPELAVADRVARLAQVRSGFFEATTPFRRALAAQALVGAASGQALRVARELLRAHRNDIAELFRAELEKHAPRERSEILEALSAAASPSTWEYLRFSRGLSARRARAIIERSLRSLLRDAGVDVH